MDLLTVLVIALVTAVALYVGYLIGKAVTHAQLAGRVAEARKDAVERSRAVLSGQFSEQLAPYLPDFPWKPTEARFIGKPVDFLVYSC